MSDLEKKRCKPCEGGVEALNKAQATDLLKQVDDNWQLNEDATEMQRVFKFGNYYETMAFVNGVAWVAHQEDHHPDLEVYYSRCVVRYHTHAINGLSENDFICAAKVDGLLAERETQSMVCELEL